jgi:hypothetical protein
LSQLSASCGFEKDDCKLLLKNEPVDLGAMLEDLELSFDSVFHVLPNSSALLPSLQPLAKRQELMQDDLIVDFGSERKAGSLKVEVLKDEFKPNPHSSKLDKFQVIFFVAALGPEEADYYLKLLNERISYCREHQVNIWKMMHTRETRVEQPAEAKSSSFFNNMFDSVRESTLAGLVSPGIQRRGTSQSGLTRTNTGSLRRGTMAADNELNRSSNRVADVETRKVELIPIAQAPSSEQQAPEPLMPFPALQDPRQILREFAVKAVPKPPAKRGSGKLGGTPPPPPPPPPSKARATSMIELRGKHQTSISDRINAEIRAAEEAAAATSASVARAIDLAGASPADAGPREPILVPKKPSGVLLPKKVAKVASAPKLAPIKTNQDIPVVVKSESPKMLSPTLRKTDASVVKSESPKMQSPKKAEGSNDSAAEVIEGVNLKVG